MLYRVWIIIRGISFRMLSSFGISKVSRKKILSVTVAKGDRS